MEDKDFEEWVKEETLKRISEFKKENPKLFPNGETNNKWDKYIEWSVRTKERGFRAGVEFGIKNSKEYLLIRCKKLCTSLDNLQNEAKEWRDERKEWQKKVEELRKWIWKNNTIPLKGTKIRLATMDGGWVNGLKLGEAIDRIFGKDNTKGEGNRTEE